MDLDTQVTLAVYGWSAETRSPARQDARGAGW